MAKGIKRRGCGWSSERTTRGGLRGSERDCSGKMSKLNWCEKVANDAAKWRAEKDDSAATSRQHGQRQRFGSLALV